MIEDKDLNDIYHAVGAYWSRHNNRPVPKPSFPHELVFDERLGQATIRRVDQVVELTEEEKMINEKQIRDEVTGAYI